MSAFYGIVITMYFNEGTHPGRPHDYFRRVDIYPGGHGIFWPNKADVCPDILYRRAQQAAGIPA